MDIKKEQPDSLPKKNNDDGTGLNPVSDFSGASALDWLSSLPYPAWVFLPESESLWENNAASLLFQNENNSAEKTLDILFGISGLNNGILKQKSQSLRHFSKIVRLNTNGEDCSFVFFVSFIDYAGFKTYLLQLQPLEPEAENIENKNHKVKEPNDFDKEHFSGFLTHSASERHDTELLEIISDSIFHPFYVIDPETHKALVKNVAAKEMESNLVSSHCFMLHKPGGCTRNAESCVLDMVINSKAPVRVEHDYFMTDGSKHTHEVFGYPVFKDNGQLGLVIYQSIDISSRKQVETDLLNYRNILDELMKNLPGMVYRCLNESNWTMEYVSPGCKKITGYGVNDLINNKSIHFGDLIFPDDRDRVWEEIQKSVSRNRRYRVEYRILGRNGLVKWVSDQGRGMLDMNGNVYLLEGFIADITAGKQADLKLQHELSINQSLAEIGVELLSESMKPGSLARMVQQFAMEYTGSRFSLLIVPSLDDTGLSFYMLDNTGEKNFHFNEEAVAAGNIPLSNYIQSSKSFFNNSFEEPIALSYLGLNNTSFDKVLGVPAFINNESAGYLFLADSFADYTAEQMSVAQRFISMFALGVYRIKAEKTLKQAKIRAEESDKLKSLFLSNMSHEIRTPMNAIVGFAEMLHESGLQVEEKDKFLDAIVRSGDSLLHLINDIIDISKIEAGQLKLSNTICNINELLSDLELTFLQELTRQKKSHISLHIQKGIHDVDFKINTDCVRLRQIITNLAGNAIKFTDEGFIEIGYRIETGRLLFYVRDSGVGISPADQKIIFERFGQVKSDDARNISGTGLGLTISKNLVELLGGTIWVDSYPNEGSTFWFTHPLTKVTAKAGRKPSEIQKSAQADFSGITILVVEDVDTNYFYISALLEKMKAKVIRAANGQKAVDLCSSNPSINLVLMDIELPVMNGYDATRAIKKLRPGLPVVAQTAFAMSGERERCLEAGCNDYLAKPIRKDDIIRVISSLI